MNVALGICIAALIIALWAEARHREKNGRRDNSYQLIDLQEEIRRRNKKERDKE